MSTSFPLPDDSFKQSGAYFASLKVSAQPTPNLSVNINPGAYINSVGQLVSFLGVSVQPLTLPTADAQWNVVCLDDNGNVVILQGLPDLAPSIPTIPLGYLPLAAISLTPGLTAITPSLIQDIRPYITSIPSISGTNDSVFYLNDSNATLNGNASLAVKRGGSNLPVAIQWNYTTNAWEFTTDGINYSALVTGSSLNQLTHNNITDWASAITATVGTLPLSSLSDVIFTGVTAGQFLYYNGTAWINSSITKGNITDFVETSYVHTTGDESIAGNKTFSGASVFTGPVSITPTTLTLNNGNSGATTSIVVDRGTNTNAAIVWDEPSQQWEIGLVGSTLPIATVNYVTTELSSYAQTAALSSYTPTSTQVIAGAGLAGGGPLSGNVTLSLPTVGTPIVNSLQKITTDQYGRVTASTNVSSNDILNTLSAEQDTVLAGPLTSTGVPTFRQLQASDLPSFTVNGDVTGSSTTTSTELTIHLNSTTVTPGSYTNANITVGADGRLTAASSGSAPNAGTVTSVALSDSSTTPIFAVSQSPITVAGTLTLTLQNQSPGAVFAGPTTGAAAQPTFRALVDTDLPTSGVTANAYSYPTSVTVDTYGRITSIVGGSAPTNGTVTSVGLADTSTTPVFAITNSPVTSSGTIDLTLINQTSGTFLAGPTTGAAAQPTFRAIASSDLPASGVTADTYSYASIAVDQYGRITSATTNTPVTSITAGTGISVSGSTGAVSVSNSGVVSINGKTGVISTLTPADVGLSNVLNATQVINAGGTPSVSSDVIANRPAAGTAGRLFVATDTKDIYRDNGTTWDLLSSNATGSVTSVGLAAPSIFSVTNSPVTSSGTLTLTLNTQNPNYVFAGPTTGAAAQPSFRGLVASDLPTSGVTPGSYTLSSITVDAYGRVTSIANGNGTISPPPINNQTGTSYTLALTDAPSTSGYTGIITMSNSSANTVTIPPNSAVAFPLGVQVRVIQLSTGQTSIVAGSGVTLNTSNTLISSGQYSTIGITQIATDVWITTSWAA